MTPKQFQKVISIVALEQWKIKTTDIKSAFLLTREVYIQLPKEAQLERDMIRKPRYCLYGLTYAARQFYDSAREQLGCTQSTLTQHCFTSINIIKTGHQDVVQGLFACHVDDFLHAGNEEFANQIITKLKSRFKAGKLEESIFKYVGFNIQQTAITMMLDQNDYITNLTTESLPASWSL